MNDDEEQADAATISKKVLFACLWRHSVVKPFFQVFTSSFLPYFNDHTNNNRIESLMHRFAQIDIRRQLHHPNALGELATSVRRCQTRHFSHSRMTVAAVETVVHLPNATGAKNDIINNDHHHVDVVHFHHHVLRQLRIVLGRQIVEEI